MMSWLNFCKLAICAIFVHNSAFAAIDKDVKPFDVQLAEFIDEMHQEHQFDKAELTQLFAEVKPLPEVIDLMTRPYEGKPWHQYHPIFVNDKRAKEGAEFWQKHRDTLQQAEEQYGVPAEMILAIMGVETRYGKITGRFPVMETLATLAFNYPRRAKFFRQELEAFLLLTREESLEPTQLKGSYAGAMGQAQFISSSYRNYAIDFDMDGKRQLTESTADAIGSIANYFKRHGWQANAPVASPTKLANPQAVSAFIKSIEKPATPVQTLKAKGLSIPDSITDETKANIIQLETEDGHDYWVGYNNFYVITRYNRSRLYAMSVYLLSQKIRAQYEALNAS